MTAASAASGPASSRCSTPFCSTATTVSGPHNRASHPAAPAVWWALTASSTRSTVAGAASGSSTTGTRTSIAGASGRDTTSVCGSARRAQKTTSPPACAAATPKVSPIAPGPMTATRISG